MSVNLTVPWGYRIATATTNLLSAGHAGIRGFKNATSATTNATTNPTVPCREPTTSATTSATTNAPSAGHGVISGSENEFGASKSHRAVGIALKKYNDTCAWTPNKVFIHFLLVSVETARVLLQSWWARLSTGASREAPVDNECLGKCKRVGDNGKSWSTGYWELG